MRMTEAIDSTDFRHNLPPHFIDTWGIGKRGIVDLAAFPTDVHEPLVHSLLVTCGRSASVQSASTALPVCGPFATALANSPTWPVDALVDNADPQDLRTMSKELLRAIDSSCRTLRWENVARLVLDWINTLEVAAEDEDGSLQRAREELRRGQGLSFDEFCEALSAQD